MTEMILNLPEFVNSAITYQSQEYFVESNHPHLDNMLNAQKQLKQ